MVRALARPRVRCFAVIALLASSTACIRTRVQDVEYEARLTPPPVLPSYGTCEPQQTEAGTVSAADRGVPYCMDLVGIPDLQQARGVVELRPPAFPDAPVTVDGVHRYDPVATISGLPAPRQLGEYTAYVAWATTLSLDSTVRLGVVSNGRVRLPRIAFENFRILITAEASADASVRAGRVVMRGTSPLTRLLGHRDMARGGTITAATGEGDEHSHHTGWKMPPQDARLPMMPMQHVEPDVQPYLPAIDTSTLSFATPRQMVRLEDGDTVRLDARIVKRRIAGRTFVMYGFNGQYPGPLISVDQGTTIHVDFHNLIDQPTTVHWHGVRLDNRFDGVPHMTQEPVEPGGRFVYTVHFRDAGIYWYHPHHREDIQQELGLYGNMLVAPLARDAYAPVNAHEVVTLDDLLVDDASLVPFGAEAPNYALMGRFGNVFLLNGEPAFTRTVSRGDVVRYFLTNVSNTRTFNLSFTNARMKLVGSDVGRFEREEWVESIVIAPAERYIVDVRFDSAGTSRMMNRVRALNHVTGTLVDLVDTLGTVRINTAAAQRDYTREFETLRSNRDVIAEIDAVRAHFARRADFDATLTMRTNDMPPALTAMMMAYPMPIDWGDGMAMMNWAVTGNRLTWIIRDNRTGLENMDAVWKFKVGDLVRLRLFNDPAVFHAMAHPIHIHGQRTLVISRNGVPTRNHVWKDTALIQAGETVELLVEMSNPGTWMIHCHIAEHLSAGMMMSFVVQ